LVKKHQNCIKISVKQTLKNPILGFHSLCTYGKSTLSENWSIYFRGINFLGLHNEIDFSEINCLPDQISGQRLVELVVLERLFSGLQHRISAQIQKLPEA
jgi:hypothetical protein